MMTDEVLTPEALIARVRQGERVRFAEVLHVIDTHYYYHPVEFHNGLGAEKRINLPGQNEGSCKIFAFAQLHRLNEAETLALFGDYYWHDVLLHPEGSDHGNIRQFLRSGWAGIRFLDMPLQRRDTETA